MNDRFLDVMGRAVNIANSDGLKPELGLCENVSLDLV